MAVIDPWGGYNQGLQNLGQTFTDIQGLQRQKRMDDATLRQLSLQEQAQSARLGEMQAQQGATQQVYGGPDLQTAYANKIKSELQAKKTTDFFNQMKDLKAAGASPDFRTEFAKRQLAKVPEYADMAQSISYIDDEKIKIVRDVGPNQIPDPTNPGQFVPPGKYELEGQATGDPRVPYKFTTIKPVEPKPQKPVDVVTQDASTFLTMKGYDMTTPEGQSTAFKWIATPAGQKEYLNYVDRVSAARYNPPPATNIVLGANPETGNIIIGKSKGDISPREVATGPLAPKTLSNPSAAEREKTAQFDVLKSQVERIKNDYKPQYVGLVSGPTGALTQYTNADEAAYRQVINDVKDSLLRARSGAQINEQEYRRLAKLVPSVNDSETKFKGKLRSFETTLDKLIQARGKAQRQGGVVFRGEQTSTGVKSGRFTVEEVK